jgi:hypothetical protein
MIHRLPIFALIGLPACVILLQWHGGAFWAAAFGSQVYGWSASLTLEWLGLWAWSNAARGRIRDCGPWVFLAVLLTVWLVAGPLFQVTRELAVQSAQVDLEERQLAKLEAREAELNGIVAKGPWWRAKVDALVADQDRLFSASLNRLGLQAVQDWQRRFLIVAEAGALLFYAIGAVVSIRVLASHPWQREEVMATPRQEIETTQETGEIVVTTDEALAQRADKVVARLRQLFPDGADGQAVLALLGIDGSGWSRIKNHRDNVATGKKGTTSGMLDRAEAALTRAEVTRA